MAVLRFKALEQQFSREALKVEAPSKRVSDYFGMYVFDKPKMQKYLSKDAYKAIMNAINKGERMDRKLADLVAAGMKAWALELGVTHYTHWFQPLTDTTAEKHDAMIEVDNQGVAFENFDGGQLVQAEPDASSFPSGGIRSTFEARGYSAWDPSSPAFIIDDTLCIPSVFISYTGEALDYKTPLLKALTALDVAATDVCQYFDKDVTKVHSTLGIEQEYFLVDDALYTARPDLSLTERTLMGHSSARDQQLEDHYFGSIPERVVAFMKDLEIESYKLGMGLKTRHNEVAPNQFECAPLFSEASLAVDQNQLLMSVMKKVARKHKFRCLLHEKPFKAINGSGKHNNWSMATNTGVNLLSPGKNPKSNLQFIVFLVNTITAVYNHSDLFRASITSAGNEHRLGAQEAPPSIISTFLGSSVTRTLDEIVDKVSNSKMTPDLKTELKLDVIKIPEILLDNTDRNRTSPFAFTGNRFEFRAVGSSANSAAPMIAVATAVADQLKKFKIAVDAKIEDDIKKDEAIFQVLRDLIIESKDIRFEGNNYSDEWIAEAEKRGLSNIKDCPTALKAYISEKSIKLFADNKVLTERESHARYEVRLELYTKKIQIESRVLGDLVFNHIIPTAISYQSQLIQNVSGLKSLFDGEDLKVVIGDKLDTIKEISEHVTFIQTKTLEMIEERKIANHVEEADEKAMLYNTKVKPYFEEIRYHVDKLELIVDDEQWTLPKYRELLFTR